MRHGRRGLEILSITSVNWGPVLEETIFPVLGLDNTMKAPAHGMAYPPKLMVVNNPRSI